MVITDVFYVACTVRAETVTGEKNCRAAVVFMPGKFNLKTISISDETFRSHLQNRLMTGKIRGLKEVGVMEKIETVVFEAVQGVNVETVVF